jgi:hypothetical protein
MSPSPMTSPLAMSGPLVSMSPTTRERGASSEGEEPTLSSNRRRGVSLTGFSFESGTSLY